MSAFKAVALRWVSDEPQPGIIEISVHDAFGHDHRIIEKDIVTATPFHRDAAFPIEFWIEAKVRDADHGHVTATLPWGMETTTEKTELILSRDMVRP